MSQTLYRFFDTDDRLLYVGISCHWPDRVSRHRNVQHWWLEVAKMTVEHFASRQEVAAAELEAIRSEKPAYNVIGNPEAQRPQRPQRPRGPRRAVPPRIFRFVEDPEALYQELVDRLSANLGDLDEETRRRRVRDQLLVADPRRDRGAGDHVGGITIREIVRIGLRLGIGPGDPGPIGHLIGLYATFLITEWFSGAQVPVDPAQVRADFLAEHRRLREARRLERQLTA